MPTIVIDVNNHRHAGEIVPVGTKLTVDDQTAAWMIERNKAHLDVAVNPSPKPKEG